MQDMSAGTQMCTSTIAERSQDDILALGLAAAKLLVERLPLSDVPHLHDWCRYVLASSRSVRLSNAFRSCEVVSSHDL